MTLIWSAKAQVLCEDLDKLMADVGSVIYIKNLRVDSLESDLFVFKELILNRVAFRSDFW